MARSKRKIDLDVVIQEMDFQNLLNLAALNRTKRNSYSFMEFFNKRKEHEMTRTIKELTRMLMVCMEKYLTGNGKWLETDVKNCNTVGQVIQAAVDIALCSLQLNFFLHCQVELALLLNGILPELPNNQESVKNSIAQYCEKLFSTNAFDRCEYFLFNVLEYLLHRTLVKKPAKADVKRIYSIRKVIGTIMEMKESRSKELWELFKICAEKPVYLSIVEGQKVIALVMALDVDKVSEMHAVISNNLPLVNIKIAMGYGRSYFEAWCYSIKSGRQDIKNVIEITCIQDYILRGIRSKQRPLLPLIRKLLAQFHCHKKELEVSKMLYCLYQPLLWRFLKNPDGQMRANATQLFLDIFPLEDPEVKVVATDLELNDQLLMIRDLLLDDFPIVRVTTILGICVSMSVNWEVFPEEMLKTYFRIIVDDLSRDSSSAEVRCAVVRGLKCLLENPLTMKCLVGILPKLQGLFHDISDNVRIAFCQMLLRVKKISAIKYFQIVSTKHLFARLEEDCHAVKKSITSLLNNSYFPRHEDPKVWMGRCLEIIKTERAAARVFFTYIASFIGIENAVKFMIQAAKAVHFYVKTKQSTVQIELSNKENILNYDDYLLSLEEAVGFNNLNVVSTVMDSITVMWLSLKVDVDQPENKCFLKMLVGKIGSPLSDLCLYYKDTIAWESVFYVSSFLPVAVVPSLASLCFWKLKNLSPDAKPEEYMTLLECLCNQRQAFELLHLLKEWIETGLTDSYVPPPAKRRKKRGKSESAFYDQPKPYLANRMLNCMFCHRGLQKAILMEEQVLKEMLYFVDYIKRKLERFNARLINEVEASFLGLLMSNILRISVFLHDETVTSGVQFVNEVVLWTDQKLVRHLVFSLDGTDNFTNLIFSICKTLCQVMADVTALGFSDPNSCIYLSFFEKLLRSGLGHKYALITARFLYKHAVTGQYIYLLDKEGVMLHHLLESLCRMFDCFCDETLIESIPSHDSTEVQYTLANVIQIVHSHVNLLHGPVSSVFRCVLKNLLDSILTKTIRLVAELSDEPFDEMIYPKVAAFFRTIIIAKPFLIATYMKFLNEYYQKSKKDIALWIACWTIVNHVLGLKRQLKPILKETYILMLNLEKTIHELYPRSKDSVEVTSAMETDSIPMQMFQRHCHGEFLKLKKLQLSRLYAMRNVKN